MIQRAFITQWGTVVPWTSPRLVEQDLIICRALVSIYNDPFLSEHLAFRGGTALHKLYLHPQPRYSEDIDLVQVNAEPIKETIDHLRDALAWLGEPVVKQKKHNNTLLFKVQPTDMGAGEIHLKVEINCKEHFSVFPMARVPFSVENDWFTGKCEVLTYQLDELVGTKVRALYQRLKGRDLFDVYTALASGKLDLDRAMAAYDRYLRFVASHVPTYKEYVLNMDEKMLNPEFFGDTTGLLRPLLEYNPQIAWERVRDEIVAKLIPESRRLIKQRKFGLIGHPIGHSASPALFAKAYGGRWQYDLIEGEDFEASWQRFLDEYQAINITAPFKEAAFRKVTECGVIGGMPDRVGHDGEGAGNDEIRAIGAINIAVKEADGKIHGYNSDYLGVMKVLRDHGFGTGSTVVVAGFGGAGKAAAAAARALGCDVVICNRTRYTPDIRPLDELPVLASVADLLIYTLAFPIPELDAIGASAPGPGRPAQQPATPDLIGHPLAILEANYRNPCLASRPGYIPGTEWHRAQAETGYPLMTGCPISNI